MSAVVPEGAVTLVGVPLGSAGAAVGARALHARVIRVGHVDAACRAARDGDGAIVQDQLGGAQRGF